MGGYDDILQFFDYSHLPARLWPVCQPFRVMAERMCDLPRNDEQTAGLRKLLEARDCAIRSMLFKSNP
jgi:hypothetical protein